MTSCEMGDQDFGASTAKKTRHYGGFQPPYVPNKCQRWAWCAQSIKLGPMDLPQIKMCLYVSAWRVSGIAAPMEVCSSAGNTTEQSSGLCECRFARGPRPIQP